MSWRGGQRKLEGPPNSHFIATLADELELLNRAVVLVLDDFQVIQNAEILALLTEWMRHPHPGLHLVLLTRHDPGLPLVAWRARNQMLDVVRLNGLRLSPDESAEFLRRASKVELHKEDVARLQAQTEEDGGCSAPGRIGNGTRW